MTAPHKYIPYPEKSLFAGSCIHCAKKEWQHENDIGDENIEPQIRSSAHDYEPNGASTAGKSWQAVEAGSIEAVGWKPMFPEEPAPPVEIPINGILRKVPDNYQELLALIPSFQNIISDAYKLWGEERYIKGSEEYQRMSPWGKTNACYLPNTDTLRDIEEEVLDAIFNTMVFRWKGEDVDSLPFKELIEGLAFSIEACRKLRVRYDI